MSSQAPAPDVTSPAPAPPPDVTYPPPPPDVTSPPPDVTYPPPDVTSPPPDVTYPPPDVTSPPPDVTSPPPDVTYPPPDVTSPPPDVTYPPPDVTYPPPDVTSLPPPPDVTSPPPPPPPPPDVTSPPPPPDVTSPGPAGPSPPVLSALIVGVVLCVLAGLGISVCVYRRKKRKEAQTLLQPGIFAGHPSTSSSMGSDKQHPPPTPGIAHGYSPSIFTYGELAKATDNFSKANLLGQGGFGYVHKGVLANGTVVAIKQLKSGSRQGEREFQAEIEIISRIHHRHLVSLFGYCITRAQRMLVYEFVPNNTLEFHLHENGRPTMNWSTTMRIAVGAAKGLAYLHEDCQPKIIHRDIKASNILIDNSFEAKVADFGLAKYSLDTETHVSTRVMGTFGYMAPEYASSGKLTEKSDVYSFGVVLLELITGHRPVDRTQSCTDDSIVDWARPLLKQALEDGNLDAVVDPKLQDYDFNEMTQMIRCAAACVRRSGRPRMSQIVRALEGNMPIDELNEGITSGSSDYNTGQYMDDLKKFRKLALESPEHDNSTVNPLASTSSQECSEPTSESGRNTFSSCSEGQQTKPEMNSTN